MYAVYSTVTYVTYVEAEDALDATLEGLALEGVDEAWEIVSISYEPEEIDEIEDEE